MAMPIQIDNQLVVTPYPALLYPIPEALIPRASATSAVPGTDQDDPQVLLCLLTIHRTQSNPIAAQRIAPGCGSSYRATERNVSDTRGFRCSAGG